MLSDVTLPPWMLWTAAGLAAAAAVGLAAGAWLAYRRRRPTVAPLNFQPLSSTSVIMPQPPGGSGRSPKPPAFMPAPAPLAPALSADQSEQRATYRRAGNAVLVFITDPDDH